MIWNGKILGEMIMFDLMRTGCKLFNTMTIAVHGCIKVGNRMMG